MIANLLPLVFLALQPVARATGAADEAQAQGEARSSAPALNASQQGAIRCSAAFAMMAERQAQGDTAALEYPPLALRGQEFFVRSNAQLMDEAGLDRATMRSLMRAEAQAIVADGSLHDLMQPCLLLLDASGL